MNKYLFYIILLLIGLASCSKDKATIYPEGTLGRYIADLNLPVQRDSLIACAASGQDGLLSNTSNHDISVLFYPPLGAYDFRYYELVTPKLNCIDLYEFEHIEKEELPIFNGYLRRFIGDMSDVTCLVTFIKNDKLFISNPINIKGESQPTTISDAVNISNANNLTPSFSWEVSSTGIDQIYFQVVADADVNLISGTYTESTSWTFYDLSNVVLNIRDIAPAPILSSDSNYKFVMMAVSRDNWVNSIVAKDFDTN